MSSKEPKVPEWVKKRKAEQEQKQDALQKYRETFLKLPVGETEILIDLTKPPEQIEKYGKTKFRYYVKVNGEEKKFDVSSQLDTAICSALMKGINPITVIRIGTTKDNTRYSVKGVN